MKINKAVLSVLALAAVVLLSVACKHAVDAPAAAFTPSHSVQASVSTGAEAVTPTASPTAEMPTATAPEPSAPAPTPEPKPTPTPPPLDFLTADFSKAPDIGVLERILGKWGFQYFKPDGKWTEADAYQLTLFQRWCGLAPSGKFDGGTRQRLLSAYLQYGETEIPRQKLPLEGRFIGINPGHQKKANYELEALSPERGSPKKIKVSAGAAGVKSRIAEHVVNLSVGLKLRDRLEAMGARVLMARTTHDVNISNGDRARMMNEAGVHVYLSLHCDGNKNRSIYGFHTLIPGGRGYQKGDVLGKSQQFAHIVQEESVKATGARDKGFSTRKDLTSLNWAKMPTCLVEMGYMSNVAEDKLLKTGAYQDKLAAGMANAFVRYFKEVK